MRADADAEPAAGYRLAGRHATAAAAPASVGPRLRQVLGHGFLASTRGRALVARTQPWLSICDAALEQLLELVPLQRLVQVYRAPLRVERQVVAAAYELRAAALLADVVRGLEFEVTSRGTRRADLRAQFLSRTFHVEVKTHEARQRPGRRGGVGAVRALVQAAALQASPHTPNLLVLGRVTRAAVARVAAVAHPGGAFGAMVWLELRPATGSWRAQLHRIEHSAHPFSPALLAVLTAVFARR